MKKYSTLAFFAFMQFIYIIAIAMCFYLFLYKGTQIFYKDNKKLAEYLQKNINKDRQAKKISNTLYMYNKINTEVLLIECGFLSNPTDRKNLTNEKYKTKYTKDLTFNLKEYFKNN